MSDASGGSIGRAGYLPALTGLRFFLALWVMLTHLVGKGLIYEPIAVALPAPFEAILRTGYLAVPVFFILSGFVLARSYAATEWTPRSLWRYLTGRFARVYPVYLLSLLIVSPFIVKAKDEPKGWLVAMHLTLLQGWFTGHYTAGWNTPAWSLSCEMFFYLLFPALILLLKDRGWGWTVTAAVVSCLLTPCAAALGLSEQIKPLLHVPDFLMGITTAQAFALLTARRRRPAGTWLSGIGLTGAVALMGYARYLPDSLTKMIPVYVLLRPLNALALLGLGLGGGWLARQLSARPLVYLGKASYAMYILHVPILWWAVSWPQDVIRYGYVAFVVAVSCVVYAVLEEPANRAIRALGDRQVLRATAEIATATPSGIPV